jgi:hypothetical protein
VVAGEHNKGLLGPEFQAVPQELVDKYTWYPFLSLLPPPLSSFFFILFSLFFSPSSFSSRPGFLWKPIRAISSSLIPTFLTARVRMNE